MKKTICRTLCLILIVIMVVPMFSSCKKDGAMDGIYRLGDYRITEAEYIYLTGMFKKRVMVSIDPSLTDEDLSSELDNGSTIADYIEATYRAGFDQTVLALLYSQSMFDKLGLQLSSEDEAKIKQAAYYVATSCAYDYTGVASVDQFNALASNYGFDYNTLISVYTKQYKESMVRNHILGESYEKITEYQKRDYYEDNYLRYQTIIINTVYKEYVDSNGEVSMLPLSEDEKKEKERLVEELKELLIKKNMDYNYILLKDKLDWSYEELWEYYDEDNRENGHYPYGCYDTSKPSLAQLQSNNVLSAAFGLKEGEVQSVIAKRFFEVGGSFENANGETTTINPGDYFEYGTVFVKRLPLDALAYTRDENKDFFGSFELNVADYVYYQALMEHENSLSYSTEVSEKKGDYTFANIRANELDFYYIN